MCASGEPVSDSDGPECGVPLDDVEWELDSLGREACTGRAAFGSVLSPQLTEMLRSRAAVATSLGGR